MSIDILKHKNLIHSSSFEKFNKHFDWITFEKRVQMDRLVVKRLMRQHQITLIVLNKYLIEICLNQEMYLIVNEREEHRQFDAKVVSIYPIHFEHYQQ